MRLARTLTAIGSGLVLVLLLSYGVFPHLYERIDRWRVRTFDLTSAQPMAAVRAGNLPDAIYLVHGRCVKVGGGVVFYARAMSHHTVFSRLPVVSFRGYTYVKVNGRLFGCSTGPCGKEPILSFPGVPLSEIDESLFVSQLEGQGFRELRRTPGGGI